MSMIEAEVAFARKTLGHGSDHVGPDILGSELTGLRAGEGLDIGGHAFFNPMVLPALDVGEGHMDQLVGHHPVVFKLAGRSQLPSEIRVNASAERRLPQVVPLKTPRRPATGRMRMRACATGKCPKYPATAWTASAIQAWIRGSGICKGPGAKLMSTIESPMRI